MILDMLTQQTNVVPLLRAQANIWPGWYGGIHAWMAGRHPAANTMQIYTDMAALRHATMLEF